MSGLESPARSDGRRTRQGKDADKPLSGERIYRPDITSDWYYRFAVCGEKFSGPTNTKNKKDAEAFAERKWRFEKTQADQQKITRTRNITVGQAVHLWRNGPGAGRHYTDFICDQVLLKFLDPKKRLRDLRKEDQITLRDGRAAMTRSDATDKDGTESRRKVKANTVNFTMITFRAILYHARDEHGAILPANPPLKWSRKAGIMLDPGKRAGGPKVIQPEQDSQIEAVAREDYAPIRKFLLLTGVRRRVAVDFEWNGERSWVNFTTGKFAYIGKGGKSVIKSMTDELRRLLWIEWCRPGRHHQFVFTFVCRQTQRKNGEVVQVKGQRYPVNYWTLGDVITSDLRKAGITGITVHGFRHTCGTRTAQFARGGIKAAKEMLDHSSITTTNDFYAGWDDDATVRAANEVAEQVAKLVQQPPEAAPPENVIPIVRKAG